LRKRVLCRCTILVVYCSFADHEKEFVGMGGWKKNFGLSAGANKHSLFEATFPNIPKPWPKIKS
jgi:hypothetical protein